MTFFPPAVDVAGYVAEPAALALLRVDVCARLHVFPLTTTGRTVIVAMENPHDVEVLEELEKIMRRTVEPVHASRDAIAAAIARGYGLTE